VVTRTYPEFDCECHPGVEGIDLYLGGRRCPTSSIVLVVGVVDVVGYGVKDSEEAA
jgi:hypothetical protein